jgi:uncharacterized protein YbjT (DUF2867 family)
MVPNRDDWRYPVSRYDADHPILVTGATGQQGGAVLRHLRRQGFAVRALTRDVHSPAARTLVATGVAVVQGDFEDRASLARALDGASGAYAVQTPFQHGGVEGELRQGLAFADAANAAGIQHLVYSSVGSAERQTGIPHFESKYQIEEHIRALGLPHTILRPVFLMENFLASRDTILGGTLAGRSGLPRRCRWWPSTTSAPSPRSPSPTPRGGWGAPSSWRATN